MFASYSDGPGLVLLLAGSARDSKDTAQRDLGPEGGDGHMEPKKPLRVYIHEPKASVRADPVDGFAQLGSPALFNNILGRLSGGRLNPRRVFYPSQTYKPQVLRLPPASFFFILIGFDVYVLSYR